MAFLGLTVLQLLLAFVSATILQRVVYKRCFLRWLASHKFTCWLAPTNQELTSLKKGSSGEKKARHRSKGAKGSPSPSKSDDHVIFKVSAANLDSIKLTKSTLSFIDLELLHNSYDLEWMFDLAVMSMLNFIITEFAFYWLSKTNDSNLSQLWICLVLLYSVINLFRLTRSYFAGAQSTGERSICIVSACVFMLIAIIVLITDESKLEFGLETAYKSFNETATAFINNHTLVVSDPKAIRKPMSFLMIKLSLAVLCALTGMVFTFPGFRYAQMHKQLFDNPETSNYVRYLTMFNFTSPLMVLTLWVRPVSRDLFEGNLRVSDAAFDSFRIYFIIIVNLIKFLTLPQYLATFLNSAHTRVRKLRRRGGSTTNKEIQLTVSSVYNYINVVALQYLLPILMCLCTVLLFKSLAGHSWFPVSEPAIKFEGSAMNLSFAEESSTPISSTTSLPDDLEGIFNDSIPQPKVITLDEIKGVFTHDVCQGVMGFATWWLHFSWFITSMAGVVYHAYFMQ